MEFWTFLAACVGVWTLVDLKDALKGVRQELRALRELAERGRR